MNKKKLKSQSISILNTKKFKEALLKFVKPVIIEEYEIYIEELVKNIKKEQKMKSLEKDKNKKMEKKLLTNINLNIIQYILNKRKRSPDELLIIKSFLSEMDFLSSLKTEITNDKLLFSLSKYLKLEKKLQNNIIFRYGNKGNKFYIVFSGELSVLILKEIKVQISYLRYFMHLIILKLLKEDDLLYKIISCNYGANKVNKNEFDFYYDNINKFINTYFGKFNSKNRYFIFQDNNNNNYNQAKHNIALSHNYIYNNNSYKNTINNIDILLDSECSSEEEEEEEEKNSSLKEGQNESELDEEKNERKKVKRAKRKEILRNNPNLLKVYNINKNLNYGEILISQMEIKKLKFIVLYFIYCRELILSKKQFSSINEYINYTFLNSPMHSSFDFENNFFDKEQFNLFQYFEITKKTKGDTFGELALQHSDNKRTGTIMTLTDTVLGYLTKNDYDLSISNIELKKRKKNVNFIMSFSIFKQMNWYVFENKYFNFFKKEYFSKGEKIMIQGQKNNKLYFIMDGQFEITTSMTLKQLYSLLKTKMGKNCDITKSQIFHYKNNNFRIYISNNKDLLGLSDCYYCNDISFINATCISIKSTVLTLEISILNELRQKNPEIETNLRKMIEKKQKIMIERLKSIYNKSIESYDFFKMGRDISSANSSAKKRIKLKLDNNKDKLIKININSDTKDNEKELNNKNTPHTLTNSNVNLDIFQYLYNKKNNLNKNNIPIIDYNNNKNIKIENVNNSFEFNNEMIKNANKTLYNIKPDLELTFTNRNDNYSNKSKRKNMNININEEKKIDKIHQIMKFKDFSFFKNNKYILKSSKGLSRLTKKKLIKLYSPINKIIDKEYSNLFDWIEGNNNNNIKNNSRYNIRYNTEEKSVEYDISNDNNKKLKSLIKKDFFSKRTTPKKINIKKISNLNSDIKTKFNEESYYTIMNDSCNKDKKDNKTLNLNKKRLSENTFSSKKTTTFSCKKTKYNNDLDYREDRLKRLFEKFLNNKIFSYKSKKKKKLNIKKDYMKCNIISNIDQYNNLSTMGSQRINFFLCSENTKKEIEIEQSKIYLNNNNNILPYHYPNFLYKKEYFKQK